MTLRDEFEPLLISRYGLHRDPAVCKVMWDREGDEAHLREEIVRATEWLTTWAKTKGTNRKAGSSYSLKHVAERWHERRRLGNPYISNGALLMAAHRLGFTVEPTRRWSGDWYDFSNAWLNVVTAAGNYAHTEPRALRRLA